MSCVNPSTETRPFSPGIKAQFISSKPSSSFSFGAMLTLTFLDWFNSLFSTKTVATTRLLDRLCNCNTYPFIRLSRNVTETGGGTRPIRAPKPPSPPLPPSPHPQTRNRATTINEQTIVLKGMLRNVYALQSNNLHLGIIDAGAFASNPTHNLLQYILFCETGVTIKHSSQSLATTFKHVILALNDSPCLPRNLRPLSDIGGAENGNLLRCIG